jgi:ubiquitin-protein ligase
MSARNRRLEADYRQLRLMYDSDPLVDIHPIGPVPADKYRIVYRVPSLRLDKNGQPIRVEVTTVELELPMDYPKVGPIARTIPGDVVFHPNFSAQKICLMDFWAPSTQLSDIVKDIGEMLQWQKLNIRSPLNAQAADWSQKNKSHYPLADLQLGSKQVKIKLK